MKLERMWCFQAGGPASAVGGADFAGPKEVKVGSARQAAGRPLFLMEGADPCLFWRKEQTTCLSQRKEQALSP